MGLPVPLGILVASERGARRSFDRRRAAAAPATAVAPPLSLPAKAMEMETEKGEAWPLSPPAKAAELEDCLLMSLLADATETEDTLPLTLPVAAIETEESSASSRPAAALSVVAPPGSGTSAAPPPAQEPALDTFADQMHARLRFFGQMGGPSGDVASIANASPPRLRVKATEWWEGQPVVPKSTASHVPAKEGDLNGKLS